MEVSNTKKNTVPKIGKYLDKYGDCKKLVDRINRNIQKIEDERQQLIREDAEQLQDGKQTAEQRQLEKKIKSCHSRLEKESNALKDAEAKLQTLDAIIMKECEKLYVELQSQLHGAFKAGIRDEAEINREIGQHRMEIERLEKEMNSIQTKKARASGNRATFNKTWNARKLFDFLTNPADEKWLKEPLSFISFLPKRIKEQYEDARKSKMEAEAKLQAQAKREQEKVNSFNKAIRERALRICSGKEPMPEYLKNNYTPQSIELNTLEYFLKQEHEKQQKQPSIIQQAKESVLGALGVNS